MALRAAGAGPWGKPSPGEEGLGMMSWRKGMSLPSGLAGETALKQGVCLILDYFVACIKLQLEKASVSKGKILPWELLQCHRDRPEQEEAVTKGSKHTPSLRAPSILPRAITACGSLSPFLHVPLTAPIKPGMFLYHNAMVPTAARRYVKTQAAWLALLGCWKASPAQVPLSAAELLIISLLRI